MIAVIGDRAAALSQSDQPADHSRQHHVSGHAVARHGVPAGDPRNRPLGRMDVQFFRGCRRADDGRGRQSLAGRAWRRRLRRRSRARQRRAGGRPAAAGDHRHARHVFDVRGTVAGRQQGPGGVSGRPVEQLLRLRLDEGVRRRPGRRRRLRRAGRRPALRPSPHAVRLSRAGGRQQSGSRAASPAFRSRSCACRRSC